MHAMYVEEFMYLRLSAIPIWPSTDLVFRNLPPAFNEHYPSTFIIIDCSEIRCEMPDSLTLQSHMYSSYQANTTLKGLVGTSPSGAVSFISSLFTGKVQ